jgi:uncharacterized protein YkwD
MNGQFRYLLLPLAIVICGLSAPALAQDANQKARPRPVARLVSSGPVNPVPRRITPSAPRSTSPTLDEANAIERRAFEETNLIRVQNGLPALTWDSDVCRLAREHSAHMSRDGYFSHTAPDGKRLRDRVRSVGIGQYRVVAENIAYNQGYEDPGAFAVERWMQSPKHRANILSPEFRAMAIGSFVAADGSVYLTQTFITR